MDNFKDLLNGRTKVVIFGAIALVVAIIIFFIVQLANGKDETSESGTVRPSVTAPSAPTGGSSSGGSETTSPEKSSSGSAPAIPDNSEFDVKPDRSGSGEEHLDPPPSKPVPLTKADFPGKFPIPNDLKVISTKKSGRFHQVKFWVADPYSVSDFYVDALPNANLYVDAQTISPDKLTASFRFSGKGYGRDGGLLELQGSTVTLIWYSPEPVVKKSGR